MALSNMLKRSASRFAPLIFSHRHLSHNHHHTSALLSAGNDRALGMSRNLLQRSFPSFLHRYSTRPSSDEALLRVIQSEIKCAEESREEEQAEEVPQGFPFKIEDHEGQQTITLTREYQGETVAVEVHMPDIITGAEDGAGDDDEEGEESANEQPSIPLVIQVSKTSGPILEFNCTAYPDEIEINSLSVKDVDAAENQIPYEGPDFSDLDENLQKAFHKYLEIRGIKPSTTNFLHGYMVDKDSKEYITWLKNLEKFIKD
ncbi:hypothetical protein F511_27805 [Dorcoceras hygrometricum]|uniref:Mitochondrial glycoprotein family protein n=1 Tax=Dorcoceras hygrometricum TaxID=472368 RepID=A0A2Z7CPV7_9LAMI|nr:hypothetical protein F511_27805 [Dorcoceras hygrometricum]